MNSPPPETSSGVARVIADIRRPKLVHYSVIAVLAAGILFLYYAYRHSLPAPAGHYLEWFWSVFYFEFKNHVLGILMLVPIMYAALTLGWRRSSLVVVALIIAVAPYVFSFSYSTRTLFESFSLLAIPAALVIAIEMLLVSSSKERHSRAEKKRERAEVMRQSFAIQENERQRISQDLHDGVAQTLLVNASTAHNMLEREERDETAVEAALEAIKENSLSMVAEIRCICQDLRPSILDNLGFLSSIKWLADNFSEETGASIELSISGEPHDLTPDENVAVFRIVQEALNNVKKHSGADRVAVDLNFDSTVTTITIKDDGTGFELAEDVQRYGLTGKLGILGMYERAQSIGAALNIHSSKGRGTKVTIRVNGAGVVSDEGRAVGAARGPQPTKRNRV